MLKPQPDIIRPALHHHGVTVSGALPKRGERQPMGLHHAIRAAVAAGRLQQPFSHGDCKTKCPGYANNTYCTFLPKHRAGNPGGYIAYFERMPTGKYRLL
jgi:hypothetical protein